MKSPQWVSRDVVCALQEESLAWFGGLAGVRDSGMLDSALARPEKLWVYEKSSLPQLAAAYAFGLARNYPFIDGNKRIAFLTATTFLESNGLTFSATEVEAVLKTMALAAGELDEAGYADWLAANGSPAAD